MVPAIALFRTNMETLEFMARSQITNTRYSGFRNTVINVGIILCVFVFAIDFWMNRKTGWIYIVLMIILLSSKRMMPTKKRVSDVRVRMKYDSRGILIRISDSVYVNKQWMDACIHIDYDKECSSYFDENERAYCLEYSGIKYLALGDVVTEERQVNHDHLILYVDPEVRDKIDDYFCSAQNRK